MFSRRFVRIILFPSGTLPAVSTLVWNLIPTFICGASLHPKYFVPADAPLLAKPVQNVSPEVSQRFKTSATGLTPKASKDSVEAEELSPELKAIITHAIVPILVQRYIAEQKRTAKAELKG
jgi:hypothetical protein